MISEELKGAFIMIFFEKDLFLYYIICIKPTWWKKKY